MDSAVLKKEFYTLVAPDLPNEWDVDEALESISDTDASRCRLILDQVRVIWPVSHSLCFDYLKLVGAALDCIEESSLSEWVNSTLDQYEKDGLRAAQRYMVDVEENFLCRIRGESGVALKGIDGKLLPYLRGLSGRQLDIVPSDAVYTDTSTVFVPPEINLFNEDADNFFLYKLIVSYQWAFIALSSFIVLPPGEVHPPDEKRSGELWLTGYLKQFPNYELACYLYHYLETIRVDSFLHTELPGLMRRKKELLSDPLNSRKLCADTMSPLSDLQHFIMESSAASVFQNVPDQVLGILRKHKESATASYDSIDTLNRLYPLFEEIEKENIWPEPLLFQGEMRLEAVEKARLNRLEELEALFLDGMSTRLLSLQSSNNLESNNQQDEHGASTDKTAEKSDMTLVIDRPEQSQPGQSEQKLIATLNNEEIELGEELARTASHIIDELGYIPEQYISSAVGKAGKGLALLSSPGDEKGEELASPIIYNEWDYRRGDYRKNWCSVIEKKVPLSRSTFLSTTLAKYHGQIVRLRYQFEMMRTAERFVRRQRDGDDIDLDALIESLADTRAGLPPSDRLFVRLKRDERDIAVLFLIDMSNSTEGWVGQVIKESLVLLCEALERVGDRYAIYGFSGMRRLRSEYFHIKHIDEQYNDGVKERIDSIGPREYTRMGPAIRHSISILNEVDSKVRLLITLTDGKPEDYDDYKGEYAIEDTRHALFEARAAGVHPFCITIDRHAHDYMEHMFGERNYIMIDDVRKLPGKMPEIYRILTH